ncbi:hypothetical protein BN13_1140006 [Nostocoides jenkinsii Ben 74]|uniref:Uncharacterized protein n=1 Tax=Nostocoides jenkinsii Ben 74 TaxID=1193518 RepID=A0A077MAG5_9MICO|nr:hypothetical protein BN13_1140006 [Tetrasphaera jenkinsii Ben 74]
MTADDLAQEVTAILGIDVSPATASMWKSRGLQRLRAHFNFDDHLDSVEVIADTPVDVVPARIRFRDHRGALSLFDPTSFPRQALRDVGRPGQHGVGVDDGDPMRRHRPAADDVVIAQGRKNGFTVRRQGADLDLRHVLRADDGDDGSRCDPGGIHEASCG